MMGMEGVAEENEGHGGVAEEDEGHVGGAGHVAAGTEGMG